MDRVVQAYNNFIKALVPVLQKRSKASYITAAIALIIAQRLYSYFRVPKHLRGFPKLSYFGIAKSFLTRESPRERAKKYVLPIIDKHDGFYISKIPFGWTLYATNPIAAKQILLKSSAFPKNHGQIDDMGENLFTEFIGKDNVALSNGDTWKRQRKVMNPAFHQSLPIKTMSNVVFSLISVIDQANGTIPVASAMQNFTLDTLGLAIFGFDFKALQGDPDEWTKTYRLVSDCLFDPVINVFSSYSFILDRIYPRRRRGVIATRKLGEKFLEIAQQKRMEIKSGVYADVPDNEKDLLTLMLEAEEKGGVWTSEDELRHNIAVLFLAGHDTTAHALSFCFYHLAKNKDIQQKLRKEVLDLLGDEPVDVVPTVEQLKDMQYLNMVIKENLRMNSPADMLFSRDVQEDITLANTLVPKGAVVSINIEALHCNPKLWHNPDQFDPERFAPGGEHEQHDGMTWLPFSNGTRQCLGMNFSLFEQRLVIAMILKKYEISIPEDSIHRDHIVSDASFNGAPKSLELTFTKRY
ncbi:cytochrome P450-dit2 [Rhizopus azygosporus]|uniref:Cytochrome P450-dit2 n=1 Tax=Rhizopus azygosporus TaxID=86630 RepID=A0A367K802_RHIAZ|nr:cytochrome P450-dit2 [Rhizopus azygosporus]